MTCIMSFIGASFERAVGISEYPGRLFLANLRRQEHFFEMSGFNETDSRGQMGMIAWTTPSFKMGVAMP